MKNESSGFFRTNLIYFVIVVLLAVVRIITASVNITFAGSNVVFSIITQMLIMFFLPLLLTKLFFKKNLTDTFSSFRFSGISIKHVFICIGMGVCLYIINSYIASIFYGLLSFLGYSPFSASVDSFGVGELVITTICSCILPAFCEEFTHRGLLFSNLNDQVGYKKATIISALMFALLHYNIGQFGYAFVIGIILANVTFYTGSIFPAMILHFMNNFLGTYISFSSINKLPLGKFVDAITSTSSLGSSLLFSAVLFIASVVIFKNLFKIIVKDRNNKKLGAIKGELVKEYLRTELFLGREKAESLYSDSQYVYSCLEEVEINGEKRLIKLNIPLSKIGIASRVPYKTSFAENIFYYASLFVGISLTLLSLFSGIL